MLNIHFLKSIFYPPATKFIIQYGSTVNGARSPNDVNVLYKGMTKSECEEIVRARVNDKLPIASVEVVDDVVRIPICEDSTATNYVVVYKSPFISSMPPITLDRHYTISAIMFNNREWYTALSKFNAKEIIGLPIQRSKARMQLIDTYFKKYPCTHFEMLCEKLWWGDLLKVVCESSHQFNSYVLETLSDELIINNKEKTIVGNGFNYSVEVWINTLLDLF